MTEKRFIARVQPNGQQWKLTLSPPNFVVLEHAGSQRATIRLARRLAKAVAAEGRPSQVVVHGEDGKVATEWTYLNDPTDKLG